MLEKNQEIQLEEVQENKKEKMFELKSVKGWANLGKFMWKDMFTGWSKGEAIFGISLIALQIGVLVFSSEPSYLGFIVAMSGTICVLLVAKRKVSNTIFGFIQTFLSVFIGLQYMFIGEVVENIMYLLSNFAIFSVWTKNLDKEDNEVITRKMSWKQTLGVVTLIVVLTVILANIFSAMGGQRVYTDAGTMVIAFVAQYLSIKRYSINFLYWFCLNVISIINYYGVDTSMTVMYIAFLINSIYGYWNWKRAEQN